MAGRRARPGRLCLSGSGPSLTVSLLKDIRELEACQSDWEALRSACAVDRPMLSPLWLLAWWRTFGALDGRQLRAWCFRLGGRLVGLAPMLVRRHHHFGLLPMRRLEFLGSGEPEADEILSEYLGPVVASGYEELVANALLERLTAQGDDWQEIVLSALDKESPAVAALIAALSRGNWAWECGPPTRCPFIKLPSSWDAYLSSLSRRNRYFARTSMRDFCSWAGDDWHVEQAESKSELARGRAILLRLHQERWNSEREPGAFSSPTFLRFHDEVMPRLLDRQALSLCWLAVRGSPVAVLYNIIWRNRVYFYQGGRSTDVPRRIRPGIVLHLEMIRRAIDDGREEYDMLGGSMRYKMQLAPEAHAMVSIRIARPGVVERTRKLVESGRGLLREVRQRLKSAIDDDHGHP